MRIFADDRSAVELERALLKFAENEDFPVYIVNSGFTIGPRHSSKLSYAMNALLLLMSGRLKDHANGNDDWSIVDVRDVANALVVLLTADVPRGRYMCSPHTTKLRNVCAALAVVFPEYPLPFLDKPINFPLQVNNSAIQPSAVRSMCGVYANETRSTFQVNCLELVGAGVEFRLLEESLVDAANNLISWDHMPELRKSQLTPTALEVIWRELQTNFNAGIIGAELVNWLKQRAGYRSMSKALRDAQALCEAGVIEPVTASNSSNFEATAMYRIANQWKRESSPPTSSSLTLATLFLSARSSVTVDETPKEFRAILQSTFDELMAAERSNEGWKFVKNEKSVLVHSRKVANSSIHQVRGVGTIQCSPQRVHEECTNFEHKSTWDPLFHSGQILRSYNDGSSIRLAIYRAKNCAVKISRFIVYIQGSIVVDSVRVIATKTIEFPDMPKMDCPESVIGPTGWIIRPEPGTSHAQVTYIAQPNLSGLPSTVVNIVNRKQPLLIANLRKYLVGKK
jgi:hypothetical protein